MIKAILGTLHKFIEKKTWERVIWLSKFKRKEDRVYSVTGEDTIPVIIIIFLSVVPVIIYKMRTEFFGYMAQLFGFR